jgi:hypothetical protein
MIMPNERITDLPQVASAQLTDIIYAVQGFVGPSNLGLSVQETLQQVFNLFQSNIILYYPGNPNGNVAGTTYQFLWDTVDNELWIVTASGSSLTAIWTPVFNPQSNWIPVASTPYLMSPNYNYMANNGATLSTFVLPVTAAFGAVISVAGFSSGGWLITENSGQSINFGNLSTTVTTGSLSSTNQNDYVKLLCVVANTTWNVIGSIGNLTIV